MKVRCGSDFEIQKLVNKTLRTQVGKHVNFECVKDQLPQKSNKQNMEFGKE